MTTTAPSCHILRVGRAGGGSPQTPPWHRCQIWSKWPCPLSLPGCLAQRSGFPAVQALQEFVGGELDVLVPPLGSPVVTGDDAYAVKTAEVALDEGVPGLGVVFGAIGEPEMPPGVFLPPVRFQEGVLPAGAGLDLTPIAVEHVLAADNELLCHATPSGFTEYEATAPSCPDTRRVLRRRAATLPERPVTPNTIQARPPGGYRAAGHRLPRMASPAGPPPDAGRGPWACSCRDDVSQHHRAFAAAPAMRGIYARRPTAPAGAHRAAVPPKAVTAFTHGA
jgi:hypothetical protein